MLDSFGDKYITFNVLKRSGSFYLANSCLRPFGISLILLRYNPELRDEDRSTSTIVTSVVILTSLG